MLQRLNNRNYNELRSIKITRNYTKYAEGSVLIEVGDTKIICNVTVDDNIPAFLKNQTQGWITAEYSMLPRATNTRSKRDAVVGKVNSRAQEISRLIGRSLRACVDLELLGTRQLLVDCDVIQADGGTRTASITGSFIALSDAIQTLLKSKILIKNPIKQNLAAISVGVLNNYPLVDLDYNEDSACDLDMNLVMFEDLSIVEIQASAEKKSINKSTFNELLHLGEDAIQKLIQMQKNIFET